MVGWWRGKTKGGDSLTLRIKVKVTREREREERRGMWPEDLEARKKTELSETKCDPSRSGRPWFSSTAGNGGRWGDGQDRGGRIRGKSGKFPLEAPPH